VTQIFAYVVRPAFDREFQRNATSQERMVVGRHSDYLEGLLDQGKLIFAGRCWDGPFGIVVIQAADEAEAQEIVDQDPSVMAGVQTAELYPFDVALVRGRRDAREWAGGTAPEA
jgi:uncharacterized protein YciI